MRLGLLPFLPLLVGFGAGCWLKASRPAEPEAKPSEQTVYRAAADLKPDVLPYKAARLVLAGTEIPAELVRKQEGPDVRFELMSEGTVLEEEHYRATPEVFFLVGLTGESYEPPMPLVRFPFTVPETWQWSGKAALGSNLKPATAMLASSADRLNLATGVADCVLVTANLTVATGRGGESKRALKFWFQPGQGIVRRDFGANTTREPRPPNQ